MSEFKKATEAFRQLQEAHTSGSTTLSAADIYGALLTLQPSAEKFQAKLTLSLADPDKATYGPSMCGHVQAFLEEYSTLKSALESQGPFSSATPPPAPAAAPTPSGPSRPSPPPKSHPPVRPSPAAAVAAVSRLRHSVPSTLPNASNNSSRKMDTSTPKSLAIAVHRLLKRGLNNSKETDEERAVFNAIDGGSVVDVTVGGGGGGGVSEIRVRYVGVGGYVVVYGEGENGKRGKCEVRVGASDATVENRVVYYLVHPLLGHRGPMTFVEVPSEVLLQIFYLLEFPCLSRLFTTTSTLWREVHCEPPSSDHHPHLPPCEQLWKHIYTHLRRYCVSLREIGTPSATNIEALTQQYQQQQLQDAAQPARASASASSSLSAPAAAAALEGSPRRPQLVYWKRACRRRVIEEMDRLEQQRQMQRMLATMPRPPMAPTRPLPPFPFPPFPPRRPSDDRSPFGPFNPFGGGGPPGRYM